MKEETKKEKEKKKKNMKEGKSFNREVEKCGEEIM